MKKEVDPFTHITKISTGFISFAYGNAHLSLSIDATAAEIDFFFWLTNEGKCFDETSTALVNYEGDRVKANYKNGGSMNCDGAFHIIFRNTALTPAALERLASKKINNIVFSGNNKTVTNLVFTPEQKQKLMDMAACTVRESKTLR
ncbi:MAG: hypothetical protein NVSMB67_08930 [Flavisolibacter sp.]